MDLATSLAVENVRTIGVDRRQVIVQQARLACKVRISSKELALVTRSTATRPCAAYKAVPFDQNWTAAFALVNQQFADTKEISFAVPPSRFPTIEFLQP